MEPCPTADALSDLSSGRLVRSAASELHRHLRGCEACAQALAALASVEVEGPCVRAPEDTVALSAGDRIGRFELIELIGAGSMGAVWSARDTELGRSVALKTLRLIEDKAGQETALKRLLREAQAMARLSHPNVVTVHEVVTRGEQVFLAMERVGGGTLTGWLRERPRSVHEVLDVFLHAGRGLQAAHDAGLVHRDFKPDNVLVGDDGRVRVTDFGLARPGGADPAGGSLDPLAALGLTSSGALVGTPAYMAPEQMRGEPIDARADVFAFCVALHEALYGIRPFPAPRLKELYQQITSGEVQPAPRGSRVPVWVRRVILRGLRADPAQRTPSMAALLDELSKDPGRRVRIAAAAVAFATLVAVLGLWARQAISARAQLCRGFEKELLGVWDQDRRAAMTASFAGTQEPYAGDASRSVARMLDGYATSWVAMRTEACEATRLRGDQSEELLDLRSACLGKRRLELQAYGDLLVHAEAKTVRRAVQAAEALDPIESCADVRLLRQQARPPADPQVRGRIAELEATLIKAKALHDAGKYQQALALTEPVAAAAELIGYHPLQAEALLRLGWSASYLNDARRADASLQRAALLALSGGRDDLAAEAWALDIYVAGYDLDRLDDGLRWSDHAAAAIERLGGDELLEALRLQETGAVLSLHGRNDQAIESMKRAVALMEHKFGADSPRLSRSLEALGTAHERAAAWAPAGESLQRALPLAERQFGPDHPSVAHLLTNLSVALGELNKKEEAIAMLRRALGIFERNLGTEPKIRLSAMGNLSALLADTGQLDEALALAQQEAAQSELVGSKPSLVGAWANIGQVLVAKGSYSQAIGYLERSLQLGVEAHQLPIDVAIGREELAKALLGVGGKVKRARALALQARATYAELHDEARLHEVDELIGKLR